MHARLPLFVLQGQLPEENLAKSEGSVLPESKMESDFTIHYRKH